MASEYIVRLISSQDHASVSKSELLKQIRETGTDKYDESHSPLFNEFYRKYRVDFFGTPVDEDKLEEAIEILKREFAEKTMGDRGREVIPDIVIIYKAESCEMITNVYEGKITSDCFRFKSSPAEALHEVIEI